MSEGRGDFGQELDRLIGFGELLKFAILRECHGEQFDEEMVALLREEDSQSAKDVKATLGELPNFKRDYQAWYSEALALVKQILPDRLQDFASYYESPRVRKEITFQNYMVRDYLQGLAISSGPDYDRKVLVDGKAAIPEFEQQLNIVRAARATLASSLLDLTLVLQADLFDSEVESARALGKAGFLRAAGAICGVVIEKHLRQVCKVHSIVIRKKYPTISDLNQTLRDKSTISVPQWRFVQHLADIRNICDHDRGREPTEDEIEDLVSGTAKILKTIS